MNDREFRVATDDDWPAIYRIFSAVTGTSDTYPYPPELSEEQARAIWMDTSNKVYVATFAGLVVATAYVKPNMMGLGDHVCNAGWMIDPDHQGQGIGRSFAEHVIDKASDDYRAMQFNAVVATNIGAIALWESLGFEIVGTVPDAFRHSLEGLTAVHIMYREL